MIWRYEACKLYLLLITIAPPEEMNMLAKCDMGTPVWLQGSGTGVFVYAAGLPVAAIQRILVGWPQLAR